MPAKTTDNPFSFKPTEAPVRKGGPGRKANPEMVKLVASLDALPISDRENREEGWVEFNAPDVSAFRTALNSAGAKLGVSFQSFTDVEVTKDDVDNPGIVKFRKVKRIQRPRKAK